MSAHAANTSEEALTILDECSWGWWVAGPEIHVKWKQQIVTTIITIHISSQSRAPKRVPRVAIAKVIRYYLVVNSIQQRELPFEQLL